MTFGISEVAVWDAGAGKALQVNKTDMRLFPLDGYLTVLLKVEHINL